jgi:glutamate formiminotransferase
MKGIVEAVPNFSEGRDKDKIDRIMATFHRHPEIKLLSVEPDADYNRTVVTLIGNPDPMHDALLDLVGVAAREIDLNHHHGEHPRMGAVDVIPFIPVKDLTMEDCVLCAQKLGQAISGRYDIPVFLYAEAASKPDRMLLPTIRKGEFEGMKEKIKLPEWKPDFGKAEIHPTFGAVAVGARPFLVAFNIDLESKDEKPANAIAKAIRKSSGGFQYVQAGPAFLDARGHVQVTMNILDYKKNPLYRIFETVRVEARRFQVKVTSSEIIGLIPEDALTQSLDYYLQAEGLTIKAKTFSRKEQVALGIKYLLFRDFDETKLIEYYLEQV